MVRLAGAVVAVLLFAATDVARAAVTVNTTGSYEAVVNQSFGTAWVPPSSGGEDSTRQKP